jgi:hypothetical protein
MPALFKAVGDFAEGFFNSGEHRSPSRRQLVHMCPSTTKSQRTLRLRQYRHAMRALFNRLGLFW